MNTRLIMPFALFMLSAPVMISCKSDNYKINVANVDVDNLVVKRYEIDLMSARGDNFAENLVSLSDKYPIFLGNLHDDTAGIYRVEGFVEDTAMQHLYDDCENLYGDFSKYLSLLENGFKHLKYYYPDFIVPEIYTYISGYDFETPVVYDYKHLILAIDMYLGPSHKPYYALGMPAYLAKKHAPQFLVRDCFEVVGDAYNLADNTYTRLVDMMIYYGKNLEFVKSMLPKLPDTVLFGFSEKQLEWCEKNEKEIWKFLLTDNVLFSNDFRLITKFVDDAPYTVFFTQDSPGAIGRWIGWKIVSSYSRNNNVSLPELMRMDDADAILKESGYRP